MATLAELYEFLEKKQDDKQIDRMFSYDTFSVEERPQARLEIFSWWEIERLVEDENCLMGKWLILCIWKYETQTWFPYFHYTKYF